MFETYDGYLNYSERENEKWHQGNDYLIEEEIQLLKYTIKDIQKCNTKEQLNEILDGYNRPINNNEMSLEEMKQVEIEEIEYEIKPLQEQLEK